MEIPTPEKLKTLAAQPHWKLQSDCVELAVTRIGGQMAPVTFRLGGRTIAPYSISPWDGEKMAGAIPPMLKALRGDFFCAPFGGNQKIWRGESHPPHGDCANRPWSLESVRQEGKCHDLHLSMRMKSRPGCLDKVLRLKDGETNIYSRQRFSEMSGPMNFGHHAMLKFPDKEASGLVSTSKILFGQVAPSPFEFPENGGYQSLRCGARFSHLGRVPLAAGGFADLSRYPARKGYEDLVMLVHESRPDFAWTAVSFPEQRYVWFSLKDPRVLRSSIFWISNGGRHYPPWNGRHTSVLGLEDVTSYFHYGLAESVRPNPVSRQGFPTCVQLTPAAPLVVNYIMGVAAIPKGFGLVRSILPLLGEIQITDVGGRKVKTPVDTSFLQLSEL